MAPRHLCCKVIDDGDIRAWHPSVIVSGTKSMLERWLAPCWMAVGPLGGQRTVRFAQIDLGDVGYASRMAGVYQLGQPRVRSTDGCRPADSLK